MGPLQLSVSVQCLRLERCINSYFDMYISTKTIACKKAGYMVCLVLVR